MYITNHWPLVTIHLDMKILHMITRLDLGGSSQICLDMLEVLKKEGKEAILLFGKTRRKDFMLAAERLEKMSVPFVYMPELRRNVSLYWDGLAFLKIAKLFKKFRPGIVHLHSSKAGFLGRAAGILCGIRKVVYMSHGHVFKGYFGPLKSYIFLSLEKAVSVFTDCMVSLTEKEIGDWTRRGFKRGKFRVLHNGIRLEEYKARRLPAEEARRRLGLTPDKKIILCVARLEKIKGVEYLIKAAALLNRDDFVVLLAGDGGERKRLEDLSRRLYLGKKIVFLGERRDIPEILSCGDFLVLPSLMEGFGISIIEGYVFSLPAVGTRVGGIPEVIRDGETGFLVAPGNEISLASALGKFLLRPSERIEMGKKGRKFLEENFTYERFEKNVISLYRTISG